MTENMSVMIDPMYILLIKTRETLVKTYNDKLEELSTLQMYWGKLYDEIVTKTKEERDSVLAEMDASITRYLMKLEAEDSK